MPPNDSDSLGAVYDEADCPEHVWIPERTRLSKFSATLTYRCALCRAARRLAE